MKPGIKAPGLRRTIDERLPQQAQPEDRPPENTQPNGPDNGPPTHDSAPESRGEGGGSAGTQEQVIPPRAGGAPAMTPLPTTVGRLPGLGQGRRSLRTGLRGSGFVRGTMAAQGVLRDLAIAASLRRAARRRARAFAFSRTGKAPGEVSTAIPAVKGAFQLLPADLLRRVRQTPQENLVLFVVDASGSMGARRRMAVVKQMLLSVLLDSYQKRDRVAFIAFRKESARLVVPPTRSVEIANRALTALPTGGTTPLAAGLDMAARLVAQSARRQGEADPILVLVTDGRANVGPDPVQAIARLRKANIPTLVIDCEEGRVRLGMARRLAAQLQAQVVPLAAIG